MRARFKKTIVTVEVISPSDWEFSTLSDLSSAITTGDCSGAVKVADIRPLTVSQASTELVAQGSDPAFLLGESAIPTGGIKGIFIKELWVPEDGDTLVRVGEVPFDATAVVLNMDLSDIHGIKDRSDSSNWIGIECVDWDGPYEVEIEDGIMSFFRVSSLDEITEEMLREKRSGYF